MCIYTPDIFERPPVRTDSFWGYGVEENPEETVWPQLTEERIVLTACPDSVIFWGVEVSQETEIFGVVGESESGRPTGSSDTCWGTHIRPTGQGSKMTDRRGKNRPKFRPQRETWNDPKIGFIPRHLRGYPPTSSRLSPDIFEKIVHNSLIINTHFLPIFPILPIR